MNDTTAGQRPLVGRAVAWIMAALVLIPTIFLATPQAAQAAWTPLDDLTGTVSKGLIETSAGNPILRVNTNYTNTTSPFALQITAPPPLGTSFYGSSSVSSRVTVITKGALAVERLTDPTDEFGGTGTVSDPFWISKTRESNNFRVTKTDSYTLGAGYIQTDLIVANKTGGPKETSVAFYADCLMAGTDRGYGAVTPGKIATCQTEFGGGQQMSLVAGSPGATLEAGHFTEVSGHINTFSPLGDNCVVRGATTPGSNPCEVMQDNSFGIKFNPTIAAGGSSTHTYFTTYGESMLISDLGFDLAQDRNTVSQGDTVTYTLSMTNAGPSEAKLSQAAFVLPTGLTFESFSGDGDYQADTGTWFMGDVPVGESRSITVTARAPALGSYTAGITNGTSSSLDLSACAPSALENCGPRVTLEVTKPAASLGESTIIAAPVSVTADGVSTSTVTVTLRDSTGMVVTDTDNVTVEIDPSLGTLGTVTNHGDGTFSAPLTSTLAGASTIGFSVEGEWAAATASVAFVAGPISQDHSSLELSEGEKLGNGVEEHSAVVTLRDENGNPVMGMAGEVSLTATPPSGVVFGAFSETSPGRYTASITSTFSGTIAIQGFATVSGSPLEIGAGEVVFTAGTVDVTHENTSFTVSRGMQPVETGQHTVTVSLADGNGSPVANLAGDLTASADAGMLGNGLISAFVETGTIGQYTASVTSTAVGTFPISVKVAGKTVALLNGGNESAVFGAGSVDLGDPGSNFTVSDGTLPVDTGAHTVTVKLVDRFGHSVPGEAGELSARTVVAGVGIASGFVATSTPGTYTASVTSEVAGSHQLTVAYHGNSVTLVEDGNDLARFSAGGVDIGNSNTGFTVSLGDQFVGEAPHTVTVRLADQFGNRVSGQADGLTAASSGNGVVGAFTESDSEPGEYVAEITAEIVGKKTITVSFLGAVVSLQVATSGVPAGNGIASFIAGVVDPTHANTFYAVSEGAVPVSVGEHDVTVNLSDRFGNPVTGQEFVTGQDELLVASIEAALGATVTSFEATAVAGTYRAVITSDVAGVKPVVVTWDGAELTGRGNTRAEFAAGKVDLTHGDTRFVVSDGDRVAGFETHQVTATLVDRFGNPVSGQAVGLNATTFEDLGGAGYVSGFTQTAPGLYTAQVASTVAGAKLMLASFEGNPIASGGNQNALFVAGDIDVSHADTSFDVSGGPVSVDGGSHLVTARLADQFGNPVTLSDTDRLGAKSKDDLGSGGFSAFAATVEPGVYTAAATSSVSGDKVVTADVDGDALTLTKNGNDIAKFISGGVDPEQANTFYTVSTGVQVVGETPHTVTVSLADGQGNPVPGVEDGIEALIAGDLGNGELGDFVETGAAGTYEASLSSTVAGTKLVTVSFGADQLHAVGNAEALFDADAVDLSNPASSYAVSTGTVSVDAGEHIISISLADKHGNPVPDQAAGLNGAAAPGIGGGAISAFTEKSTGNYEATISSTVAGTQRVTATFGGTDISLNGNNGDARFSSAEVDLANAGTVYTVSTGSRIVGEEEHRVSVNLADKFGNPVPGRASQLSAASAATLGSGAIAAFVERSDAPGSYSAQVSSTSAGEKLITAQFDAAEITKATDGNDTASFVAGDVSLGDAGTAVTVTDDLRVAGLAGHVATVTLADRYGNPVSGQETALASVTADDLGAGGISVFTAGSVPGSYTATIVSTVAGDKMIVSTINGAQITLLVGGNDLARFTAGVVDYGHPGTGFTVTGDERVAGVESHRVTATLVDASGNAVSGLENALTATAVESLGNGEVSVFAESATVPGSYSAAISSTLAGEKQIAVTLEGITVSLVEDGNDRARFSAGGVDLTHENSTYVVSGGGQPVGDGAHTVTVSLVDAFGNGVANQAAQLAGSAADLGAGSVSGFVDLGEGAYRATLTSTVAGIKPVTVNLSGAPVIAPASVNTDALFLPGDVDVSHELTGYAVTDTEEVVGAGVHTVTIQLADSFGNPVPGRSGDLVALASDLGAGAVASVTEAGLAGTYSAIVTSTLSGVKPVTVELVGTAISALNEGKANTDAVFIAGDVDLGHDGTSFVVSEGEVSIEMGRHSVTVTLVDALGNPVPGAASELHAVTAATLGTGVVGAFVEDADHAGMYVALVSSTVAGDKAFTVTYADESVLLGVSAEGDVLNDVARFISGGVDVGNAGTQFTVTTDSRVAGEETHTVTVTLADAFGNPVAGQAAGVNAVAAESLGNGEVASFVETAEPGTYEAAISSTVAGVKSIAAVFGGATIAGAGNTEAVFVAGAVDFGNTGTAYSVTTGSETVGIGKHTVTVTLVDKFGNPASGLRAHLVAVATGLGGGSVDEFSESASEPGMYTAEVSSTLAGTKPVTVTLSGDAILGAVDANTAATFVAGAVDLTHEGSGYEVSTGAEFVGTGRHTLFVQLVDMYGNKVDGSALELTAATVEDLGNGAVTPVTESATPGTYGATITSTVAGAKPMTVTFEGVPVSALSSGNTDARFAASGVDFTHPDTTYVVTDSEELVGTGQHTVTATLADGFGNPVSGQAAELFAVATDLGDGLVSGFVEVSSGKYLGTITSTMSGTKPVTVDLMGAPVLADAAANTAAVFVAGDVDLGNARTAFSVSGGEVSTENGIHSATVRLADRYGNPVSGHVTALALVTVDDLGSGGVGSFVETVLVPGEYTAPITSTVSGKKHMTASFSGDPITVLAGDNDIALFVPGGVDVTHQGTTYTVSEDERVVAGDPHTITATLVDRNGNPVSGQQAGLNAATVATLGSGSIGAFAETGVAGTYLAEVVSTSSGTKPITAHFGGAALEAAGNADAVFVADAVDFGSQGTGYSVTGGEEIVGTGSHTVLVTLVDRFGNPVLGQGGGLAAVAVALGSGAVTEFSETTTAGNYVAIVTSTIAGAKQVTVDLHGEPITAAATVNTIARFTAGPVAPQGDATRFNVSDGMRIVGEGWHTISVLLSDEYQNPVAGKAAELTATVVHGGDQGGYSIAEFMETGDPGWYSAVVTSTIAGDKILAVDVAGSPIGASGNDTARFVAANVDFGHEGTGLVVSTGHQPVGTGVHTVTVTLADRFGNPISGLAGEILGGVDGALGAGSVTSFVELPTAGTYTATVTSTISGVKLMSAIIAGETIPVRGAGNAAASFVAGPVDVGGVGTAFTVSDGNRVAGSGSHLVSITLADAFGNPVGGEAESVAWATVDSLGIAPVTAVVETTTPGTYRAEIASSVRGLKTITVTAGGEQLTVAGNDVARFVTDEVPAPPVVDTSDGSEITGCALPGSTVTVYDKDGNVLGTGVADEDCRFVIPFEPPLEEGTDVLVTATDEDGNESEPAPLRIGLIKLVLDYEVRTPAQKQVATGLNFQPGENVTGTLRSTPVDLGTLVADTNGIVVFDFSLPEGIELGDHRVILTGERSGSTEASFRVVEAAGFLEAPILGLAVTGAQLAPFAGIALGVLLLGSLLLLVSKRRKDEEEVETL